MVFHAYNISNQFSAFDRCGGSVARAFASQAGYQGLIPGRHRHKLLKKARDSSTAKCLATDVSVIGNHDEQMPRVTVCRTLSY